MIINALDLLNLTITLSNIDAALIVEILSKAETEDLAAAADRASRAFSMDVGAYDAMSAATSFETHVRRAVSETQRYASRLLAEAEKDKPSGTGSALAGFDGPVQ